MQQYSVWLVDDMKAINLINSHVLNKVSVVKDIQCFTNPNHCLEALTYQESSTPNILIVDINMPQMSGFEFLDQLSTIYHNAAVFILTTSINPSDKERSKKYSSLKGFLLKPLTVEMIERDIIAKL